MIKDFKTKNSDGRLIIQKKIFGIGFNIDFVTATFDKPRLVTIYFDLIFIRFWLNIYKSVLKRSTTETDKNNTTIKEEYSMLRHTIELTFIKKLNECKWWQFKKRRKVYKWREQKLRKC